MLPWAIVFGTALFPHFGTVPLPFVFSSFLSTLPSLSDTCSPDAPPILRHRLSPGVPLTLRHRSSPALNILFSFDIVQSNRTEQSLSNAPLGPVFFGTTPFPHSGTVPLPFVFSPFLSTLPPFFSTCSPDAPPVLRHRPSSFRLLSLPQHPSFILRHMLSRCPSVLRHRLSPGVPLALRHRSSTALSIPFPSDTVQPNRTEQKALFGPVWPNEGLLFGHIWPNGAERKEALGVGNGK